MSGCWREESVSWLCKTTQEFAQPIYVCFLEGIRPGSSGHHVRSDWVVQVDGSNAIGHSVPVQL